MSQLWQRQKEIFQLATRLPGPEALAKLPELCNGDLELLTKLQPVVREYVLNHQKTTTLPGVPSEPNGRFRLISKLGAGSFGDVYHAYDEHRRSEVALKVLRNADPAALLYFKGERRNLKDLRHPNLVELYELILDNSQWMLTMELVPGTHYLDYIRAGGSREQKIRHTLPQLAGALNALHSKCLLHRDLKPSNILVTPQERVVVLDFGLARNLDQNAGGGSLVGTPYYMSPEQVAGLTLTASSDWYALGVLLYEALADRVPFSGTFFEVLQRKLKEDPVPPSELCDGVASDLNALCMSLLRREPHARAAAIEPWSQGSTRRGLASQVFVGREAELALLQDAFTIAMQGAPVVAHVCGRSGIGKSTLVREFLTRLRSGDETVLVFAGRCYERESVPYSGVDDLIDNITQYLRQVSHKAQRLLPRNFHLLTRTFPVLGSVAAQQNRGPVPSDTTELRSRTFAALRELIGRIAETRPVVLVIDDLQWANADGCALLEELMFSRDTPAVLLLLSYRSEDQGGHPALTPLRQPPDGAGTRVTTIDLQELPLAAARQLALALAGGGRRIDSVMLNALVEESGGDPFLIDLIIEGLDSQSGSVTRGSVDSILQSRIAGLSPEQVGLLELVAVAGRPTHVPASSNHSAESRDRLLDRKFFRSRTVSGRDELEVYHDRIRQVVIASMNAEIIRERHAELARYLEAEPEPDAEGIAIHLHGAGEYDKARPFAIKAGARAAEALAFNIAADYYRLALQCCPRGPEKRELSRWLGDALSNAGRGPEAAEAYLAASEGAERRDRLLLLCEAAGQLLRSGYIQRGGELLNQVISEGRFWSPQNPSLRLLWLYYLKLRLRVRGLDFRERTAREISPEDSFRLSLFWTAANGLSVVHPIQCAEFTTRFLLLALDVGDPYRIALGLSAEAAHTAAAPGIIRHMDPAELLDRASKLADRINNAHARGLAKVMRAVVAYLEGNWREISPLAEEGAEMLRSTCSAVTWELGTANIISFVGRSATGQFEENRRRLPALIKDAEDRGDLFNKLSLRLLGCAYILETAADRPESALEQLERDVAAWPNPRYDLQKCNALLGTLDTYLYMGQVQKAWSALENEWPLLLRSELLRVPTTLAFMRFGRGRVALAMAARLSAAERGPCMKMVSEDEKLIRSRAPRWTRGLAGLLASGIATFSNDSARVLQELKSAASALNEAGMVPHRQAALYRLAQLQTEPACSDLMREIEGWAIREGVAKPAKLLAALAPGLWPMKPT